MIFQLRENRGTDINGKSYTNHVSLKKQTEKGLLLSICHRSANGEREVCYWLPKSKVLVDNRQPWGEINLASAKKIEIPEWIWERRRPE